MSQQVETPQPKEAKSKLDLLADSLSSIIDDMSSFSSHSDGAVEPKAKLNTIKVDTAIPHSKLNIDTPIQSEFNDEYSHFTKLNPQFSQASITQFPINTDSFEQLLHSHGYSSYILDFHQTGVGSLSDLIRFATQYLPPALNVTPAPADNTLAPYKQIKFTPNTEDVKEEEPLQLKDSRNSFNTETDEQKTETKTDNTPLIENTKRIKKHKRRLYEVEELLHDEEYCEYALLIRDGGNHLINGYYTCSGRKNERFMFNHMNDNKAALYCAKNGTWMVVYDDELLYGNPLKYDSVGGRDIMVLPELNMYPPPPRCWYAIEGVNPPPGVMWIQITDDPMAFIDEDLAKRTKEHNMNIDYMNQLKVDLPVQMIDFMFCGPIGFALRIDESTKVMDVIRIKEDGQAKELGLKYGDTLLKINEEDISKTPNIAFPFLKECVQSDLAFEVTFLRKKYDELVINVQRAGSPECNGKYVFLCLDEVDAPIFVKDNDMDTWRILRLDHDEQDGQSIWGIQNIREMNEYYIGISNSYSPPNNTWETIGEVGNNPAPGLQFVCIDDNVMRKLVADDVRQTIFTATRRKGMKMIENAHANDNNLTDETYEFGDGKSDNDVIVSLNSFKLELMGQKPDTSQLTIQSGKKGLDNVLNEDRDESESELEPSNKLPRKVSFNPANLAKHTAMMSGNSTPGGSAHAYNMGRSDSIMSTKSVYAVPDEVTTALKEYQNKIGDLEKQLKAEKKRTLTLSHRHKTQQSVLVENEEKMNVEKETLQKKVEDFRDELYTVNHAYYELWIKQSETKLDHHKVAKENHRTTAKFSQTKKQLFQAKRKIQDLTDDNEELERELENEKVKNAENNSKSKEDELFFSNDAIENDFERIELQTDIASLKTTIAAKEIEIDELHMDNDQWQAAHDSIFERMTEAQTRLAKEIEEYEDAKKFYENKLSVLRDTIQDNTINFWEYEKRLIEMSKVYENETGKKFAEWKNKPNIRYDTSEEKRVSITFGKNKRKNKGGRDSVLSMNSGWDALSVKNVFSSSTMDNPDSYKQRNTLYDAEEDDMSDSDNNNAFGSFTATINCENEDNTAAFGAFLQDEDENDANGNNDNQEFEIEESDDGGVNAFGTIDD